MNTWQHALTILIIIFGGGLVVGKITERPRIPDVAAYLVYGILIGPALLGVVSEPSQSQVNQLLLNLGATLILFDGGRGVRLAVLKRVWRTITMLATVGVLVSALVMGIAAHGLLGLPWVTSFLLGSVIASTDPATLIPVFKRVSILPKLQQTVECESAFNDATGAVLVFTILNVTDIGSVSHAHWYEPIVTFGSSALIGLGIGCIIGTISIWLVSLKAWGIFHEYGSIVMLVAAITSYQLASSLNASGFMAAFTAGIVAGNADLFGWSFTDHAEANISHFGSSITLIMRMLIFVLLGTQVDFTLVAQHLWAGLLLIGIFMCIARPVSVFASVWVDWGKTWNKNHVTFMCWVRETGVIPVALSGVLLAKGVRDANIISSITFMAILLTIILQASTTGYVAKRLGVLQTTEFEEY